MLHLNGFIPVGDRVGGKIEELFVVIYYFNISREPTNWPVCVLRWDFSTPAETKARPHS